MQDKQQKATKAPAGKPAQKKQQQKESKTTIKGPTFVEQLYAKYEGKPINQLSASLIEAELQRIEKQVAARGGEPNPPQKNAIAILKHWLKQTEGRYRGFRRPTKAEPPKAREHIVQEENIAADKEAARTPKRSKAEKPTEDLESMVKYFGEMTVEQVKLEIMKRDKICLDLPKHNEVRRVCGREISRLHRYIALLRQRDGIVLPSHKERLKMRLQAKIQATASAAVEEEPAGDESFCLQAEASAPILPSTEEIATELVAAGVPSFEEMDAQFNELTTDKERQLSL